MFPDRITAGRQLATALAGRVAAGALVLGLARGGLPVAREVASALGLPLDVLVVRKIGAPGQPEFAVGAVAEDGSLLMNEEVLAALGGDEWRAAAIEAAREECRRRVIDYRGGRPLPAIAGREVILIDDGIATGLTMACAVRSVRTHGASRIIVAAPTASHEAVSVLRGIADEVVVCEVPALFLAVGAQYEEFPQVSDAAVIAALAA